MRGIEITIEVLEYLAKQKLDGNNKNKINSYKNQVYCQCNFWVSRSVILAYLLTKLRHRSKLGQNNVISL